MDLQSMGKMLVLLALGLAIVGALFWVGGRMGLGSLPGNFKLEGENWSCYVPIMASIVISLLLTVVLNVIIRWFR